ncbi:hypothetical protein [Pseudomonas sp. MWU318]|uniref:hypothetical protein n=1 Tax=Pseudomonas sp. MWU318 TaxID=2802569 RepID=UPI00192879A9|nr:hypothetical protein [Pseudomonas sp. MWU318]
MSEITRGVIGMPLEMAMESELSRRQFHSIAQDLLRDFDRVTAERDALQERLNAADQRIDELTALLLRSNELFYAIQGDPGAVPSSAIDAMRGEVFTALKKADGVDEHDTAEKSAQPFTEQFLEDQLGKMPECIKGMIEARGGKFAIMIDEANSHYGWTFKRHPDGMWVSGRKATDAEMQAARQYARHTNQQ